MTKIKNNYFTEILNEDNLILAPMAGITNLPYRLFMKEMGCKIFISEMVSAKGMFYNSKNTFPLMETVSMEHEEAYKGLQIFGSDPKIMGQMTDEYVNETNFDFIDINMGCPMKKVINNGDGSALLKDLNRAKEVIKSVKKYSIKPVSVKVRLGFYENIILDIVRSVEDAGADMISIHGRTREELFSGEVHYDSIKKAKEILSIPVIANGNLQTPQIIKEQLEFTGADGGMIGRSANYNPFIFMQYKEYIKSGKFKEYSSLDLIRAARKHFDIHIKYSNSKKKINEFRKYMYWYIKGIKNSAKIRGEINYLTTPSEVYEVFDKIEDIISN